MGERVRYVGLAEESVFNMETPPNADFHVDIASAGLDTPTDTQLIFSGGLHRSARTHKSGFYSPSGNIVYAFDVNTIGFLLKWALGGYDFVDGGAGLNTHDIWGSEVFALPSFCARIGKDLFEHVFSGCSINTLEIQVEGEFCMATADIIAAKDSKATIKDVGDLILPDQYPLAFHEVTAAINEGQGSDVSAKVKSLTLTINNNISAENGRSIGSRYMRRAVVGERVVTLTKNMFFEDLDALEEIWGGASGPANSGSTEMSVDLNFDAGEGKGIAVHLPRFVYSQVQLQPSGRDELVQSTSGRAYADTMNLDGTPATEIESDIHVVVLNNEDEMATPEP